MNDLSSFGKLLAISGLALAAMGGLMMVLGKGFRGVHPLPGDLHIDRGTWSFSFPIVICLLISLVLTLLLQFVHWLRR